MADLVTCAVEIGGTRPSGPACARKSSRQDWPALIDGTDSSTAVSLTAALHLPRAWMSVTRRSVAFRLRNTPVDNILADIEVDFAWRAAHLAKVGTSRVARRRYAKRLAQYGISAEVIRPQLPQAATPVGPRLWCGGQEPEESRNAHFDSHLHICDRACAKRAQLAPILAPGVPAGRLQHSHQPALHGEARRCRARPPCPAGVLLAPQRAQPLHTSDAN
jgi:hypothetical protein